MTAHLGPIWTAQFKTIRDAQYDRFLHRTSVEQYRNAPKPIPVIAEEMNVSYILEGSGQKYGNKVRITLQLLDAINDKHLWSTPYNREIEIENIWFCRICEKMAILCPK